MEGVVVSMLMLWVAFIYAAVEISRMNKQLQQNTKRILAAFKSHAETVDFTDREFERAHREIDNDEP